MNAHLRLLYAKCGHTRTATGSLSTQEGAFGFTHGSLFGNAILCVATTAMEDLPRLVSLIESGDVEFRYPEDHPESYRPNDPWGKEGLKKACLYRLEHEVTDL